MTKSEIELEVWYQDREGRPLRALDFVGRSKVRYQDGNGTVGEMDAKTFASRCVLKADPTLKE